MKGNTSTYKCVTNRTRAYFVPDSCQVQGQYRLPVPNADHTRSSCADTVADHHTSWTPPVLFGVFFRREFARCWLQMAKLPSARPHAVHILLSGALKRVTFECHFSRRMSLSLFVGSAKATDPWFSLRNVVSNSLHLDFLLCSACSSHCFYVQFCPLSS